MFVIVYGTARILVEKKRELNVGTTEQRKNVKRIKRKTVLQCHTLGVSAFSPCNGVFCASCAHLNPFSAFHVNRSDFLRFFLFLYNLSSPQQTEKKTYENHRQHYYCIINIIVCELIQLIFSTFFVRQCRNIKGTAWTFCLHNMFHLSDLAVFRKWSGKMYRWTTITCK